MDYSTLVAKSQGSGVRGEEMLYWYDPPPHEEDQSLTSTLPHRKLMHPDIRRHRIPASGISFEKPNLEFPIREMEPLTTHSNVQ